MRVHGGAGRPVVVLVGEAESRALRVPVVEGSQPSRQVLQEMAGSAGMGLEADGAPVDRAAGRGLQVVVVPHLLPGVGVHEKDGQGRVLRFVLPAQAHAPDQVVLPLVTQHPEVALGLGGETVAAAVFEHGQLGRRRAAEERLGLDREAGDEAVGDPEQRAVGAEMDDGLAAEHGHAAVELADATVGEPGRVDLGHRFLQAIVVAKAVFGGQRGQVGPRGLAQARDVLTGAAAERRGLRERSGAGEKDDERPCRPCGRPAPAHVSRLQ